MDGVDFHVLSTAGNTSLGGADFDDRLAQLILNKFNQQFDYDYNQNTLNDLDDIGIRLNKLIISQIPFNFGIEFRKYNK